MNLHALVRSVITTINPDTLCTWQQSTGYTTNDDGTTVPTYNEVDAVPMQVQGLSTSDLRHMEFLNIQGVLRKVYAYGNVAGVVRPSFQGGDLILFPQQIGGTVQVWKVVHPMETWPDVQAAGWSAAIVCLQMDVVSNKLDISSGNVTLDNSQITGDAA